MSHGRQTSVYPDLSVDTIDSFVASTRADPSFYTIKPITEIMRQVYQIDFDHAKRQLFKNECKELGLDPPIKLVPQRFKKRWLELVSQKPVSFNLTTDEDFAIFHYLLNTSQKLHELNCTFNDMVLRRAYGPKASDSVKLIKKPVELRNRDQGLLLIVVGIVAVFVLLAFTAIVGLYYAAEKFFKSTANLFRGEKVLRSFFRLSSTVAAGIGGAKAGLILGIMVGTLFPGLGTLIGGIIGLGVGACVGAGAGALVAKYVGQAVSWLSVKLGFYGKENIINPSNPEKYRLSASQTKSFIDAQITGEHNTSRIYEMLDSAKIQKSTINTFFDRAGDMEKAEFNSLINNIKSNPEVVRYGICLNQKSGNIFLWTKGDMWARYHIEEPERLLAPRPVLR
jgi:hypothetical protein